MSFECTLVSVKIQKEDHWYTYTKHCGCHSSPCELTIFSWAAKPSLQREQNIWSKDMSVTLYIYERYIVINLRSSINFIGDIIIVHTIIVQLFEFGISVSIYSYVVFFYVTKYAEIKREKERMLYYVCCVRLLYVLYIAYARVNISQKNNAYPGIL